MYKTSILDLAERYIEQIERFQRNIEQQRQVSFREWLHANWLVKFNRQYQPFSFRYHEFQERFVSRFMVDVHTVVRKPSQKGYSDLHLAGAFYLAEQYSASSVYFYPTRDAAGDFSKGRASEVIRNNPYLRDHVRDVNNEGLKKFFNGLIWFRGLGSELGGKSVQADAIFLDERNDLAAGMAELAKGRLGHSDLKFIREFSTPSVPGFGIDLSFAQSNQQYFITHCLSCRREICFEDDFPGCILQSKDGYYLGCARCAYPICWDRNIFEWVAKRPDEKDIIGYTLTGLHYPLTDIGAFYKSYRIALDEGEEAKRRWLNENMGLPHSGELQPLTDEVLQKACQDYDYHWGPTGNPIFMGVDQGDTLFIVIGEKLKTSHLRVLLICKAQDFSFLDKLMREFHITFAVVDAGPNRMASRDFVQRWPGRAVRSIFSSVEEPIKGEKDDIPQIKSERNETIDKYVVAIQKGLILFPRKSSEGMEEFLNHHKALIKEKKEDVRTGEPKYEYKKGVKNDFGLAGTYMFLAATFAPSRLENWQAVYVSGPPALGTFKDSAPSIQEIRRFEREFGINDRV
jgi:hypothetical protein